MLEALIEEAIVDAYGEGEQKIGLLTMMQEHLAPPFAVGLFGVSRDETDVNRSDGDAVV